MARTKVVRLKKDTPATWQDALQQYLWFKQAEGLRQITLKGHKDVIGLLFRRHPAAYPNDIKPAVYAFMGEQIKPATYNIRRNYLLQFFSWCVREGIFTENPLASFKKRTDEGRTVAIDSEILARLISLPDKKTFAGVRDRALILFTLDTAIRPNEAFSVLPSDINLRSLEIYVRPGSSKTKVSRTLPISPLTAKAIKDLLAARHSSWEDSGPVFCSSIGTPLNRHTWNDRLETYSSKLGFKIRPYDLRHCAALYLLRNGCSAFTLRKILGHTTMQMTTRYLNISNDDIKREHVSASPVANLIPSRQRVKKIR